MRGVEFGAERARIEHALNEMLEQTPWYARWFVRRLQRTARRELARLAAIQDAKHQELVDNIRAQRGGNE